MGDGLFNPKPSGLGRYQIERELGSGGMSTVYLARDPSAHRVAIKVPRRADATHSQRFQREVETLATLRHPSIVPLLDVGTTADGRPYFVMEWVEGSTLTHANLGLEATVRALTEVAHACDYAHAQGIVHHDLKPENVLMTNGRPRVVDFGIAKVLDHDERLTQTGALLGTPLYMPPEQLEGDRGDPRSDQYPLGVMLYEATTGRLPYGELPLLQLCEAMAAGPPPKPSRLNPRVSATLEAVILQALEPDPLQRFSDAGALARALASCPEAGGARAGQSRSRLPWIAAGLTLATASIGSGLAYLATRPEVRSPPGVQPSGATAPAAWEPALAEAENARQQADWTRFDAALATAAAREAPAPKLALWAALRAADRNELTKLRSAVAEARRGGAEDPWIDCLEAWGLLGLGHHAPESDEAEAMLRAPLSRLSKARPEQLELHYRIAMALRTLKRDDWIQVVPSLATGEGRWAELGETSLLVQRARDAESPTEKQTTLQRALDTAQACADRHPSFWPAQQSLVSLLLQDVHDWPRAEREARNLVRKFPQHPEAHYLLAFVLKMHSQTQEIRPEELRESVDCFLRASSLRDEPHLADLVERGYTRFLLAQATRDATEFELAEGDLQRAVALAPRAVQAWLVKGILHESQQQTDEAAQSYQRAAELKPERADLWQRCARALTQLGRHVDAREHWTRALDALGPDADPKGAASYAVALGWSCLQSPNDPARAAAAFDRALELDPSSSRAAYYRARLAESAGELELARTLAAQALRTCAPEERATIEELIARLEPR